MKAFAVYLFLGGIASARYLPMLKSGEQIAREKDTQEPRKSTKITTKRERTTDGTERGADKEVKRRKCPPTSGNGKRNEKRMRKPRG